MTKIRATRWNRDILQVFKSQGIHIWSRTDIPPSNLETSSSIPTYVGTMIHKGGGKPSSGFQKELGSDGIFVLDNTQFFMNGSDVRALQKAILNDVEYRPMLFDQKFEEPRPLRVLVLDRAGESRAWKYSQAFANETAKVWTTDQVQIKILSNFVGYSLHDQAIEMHHADIIISSHGAQLTNSAFIRPCTVVLELFPVGFVIGYFQPMILAAGSIPYVGYPQDQSYGHDNQGLMDGATRLKRRGLPILASYESILRALNTLIKDHLACKRSLYWHVRSQENL